MSKLIHKNKTILNQMKYASSPLSLAKGLMFATKNKIKKGICLALPGKEDQKTNATITMLFVFHPLEIIFINTKMQVVDKTILNPWKISYIPKKPCKYVIETTPGTLKNIKIGDQIKIEK